MSIRWQSTPFPVGGTRSLVRLRDGSLLAAHPRSEGGLVAIFCIRSRDQGKTWQDIGQIVRDPERDADLGDGSLLLTKKGELLYTYRQNHYRGSHAETPDYAIRVAASRDGGVRWQPHSTVTAHSRTSREGPSQGLWAPFLYETPEGRLQCCYDDEKTPLEAGFPGHQWLMARTWNAHQGLWQEAVVVSRAHDARHLSRDGMGTVVALPSGLLLCALESVQVKAPHANVVRWVSSDDDGRTWSWQPRERGVLYQPADPTHGALCPYLTQLSDRTLACVFCTDEDRETPSRPGTPPPQGNWDIKCILSADGGRRWSAPETITDSHATYLSGIVEIAPRQLLVTWIDFARKGIWGTIGTR